MNENTIVPEDQLSESDALQQFRRQSLANDKAATQKEEEDKKQLAEEAEQRKAELENSHAAKEAKDFGLAENLKELQNAVIGGTRDTASSIATLPERAVDMVRGENVGGEGYKLDFDPLGGGLNPETKTWWGNAIRGVVHFGTTGLAITAAAAAATAALPATAAGGIAVGAGGVLAASRASRLAQAAKWVATGGKLAGKSKLLGATSRIGHGAFTGGVTDLISEYSQGDNALGSIAKVQGERFPSILEPLATKDTDHPLMKTMKNITEGLFIGGYFDTTVEGVGLALKRVGYQGKPDTDALINNVGDKAFEIKRANAEAAAKEAVDLNLRKLTTQKLFRDGIDFQQLSPEEQIREMSKVAKKNKDFKTWSPPEDAEQRAVRKTIERGENVRDQTLEQGKVELEQPGYGPHKNKPIGEFHQGNPNSTGLPYDVSKQSKRISGEWGSDLGSTDQVLTTAAVKRIVNEGVDMSEKELKQVAKELLGDVRLKALIREIKKDGGDFATAFKESYSRMQELVGGRDAGQLSPNEFWGPIIDDITFRTGGKDSMEAWSMQNVITADLVNASLFKKLRDLAVVGRELQDHVDIMAKGSVMDNIRDNLIVGLSEAKRSRYLISQEFRSLQAQNPALAKKSSKQNLIDIHENTKSQVDMMLEMARKAPNDEMLHALLEAFSMSNKIHNWEDFDLFMRKKLLGSSEGGVPQTGMLVREMQGMMINSVLSGPKTPLRAIMGTSTAVFTRPMAQLLGGGFRFLGSGFADTVAIRQALASTNAMVQAVPEAFQYFKARLNGYWSGDVSTIKTRFSELSTADHQWTLMGHHMETRGTQAEKAAYYVANLARAANNNNFLTYSTKFMAATDDAFTMILARARAKEKALNFALETEAKGIIPEANTAVIRNFEDRFYNEIFDPSDGSISDVMLNAARKEATLTKDLTGFAKGLETLFDKVPLIKPFYLFARTGVNGLEFSAKHIPGINLLVKEYNDILFADPSDLSTVLKYGIETPEELANAKALANGRWLMGSGVIFMAGQHYLNGNLTGNGPADVQKRQSWLDAGWKPRSIRFGDLWVSYDSFEPFSNILASVADIGDNAQLMGTEWEEQNLATLSLITAKAFVSKTYLQGMQQLIDVFSNDPRAFGKIATSFANNTVPLSSIRNEIGRVINPHMKELSSSWTEQLRNRNLFMEGLAGNQLPTKYDILTGQPINDWDVATRLLNAVSPVQFNLDQSPGRKFLFQSGYDIRTSTMTAPDSYGTKLNESPRVRSAFQKAIGDQDLETKLAKLAKRKDVQQSLRDMEAEIASGRKGRDPMSFPHNILIKQLFDDARSVAWAQISNNPEVRQLISASQLKAASEYNLTRDIDQSRSQYDQATQLLENTNR